MKRKEIAEKEYISEETVKHHITHILKKLNFPTTKRMIDFLENIGVMELFNTINNEQNKD